MAVLAIPNSLYAERALMQSCRQFQLLRGTHSDHRSLRMDRRQRLSTPSLQTSAFLNPQDDPLVKEVLKEPLAFLGGVFAGVLRLDLNEDPLREWVVKTSEAAGVQDFDEVEVQEETPEEITIE
ncbi:hypothetical protein L7F22_061960 [Adiantum nelumboides]|nr:hypothetical protein [Adiantum nelumboides]